jgi:hypothetical protein
MNARTFAIALVVGFAAISVACLVTGYAIWSVL